MEEVVREINTDAPEGIGAATHQAGIIWTRLRFHDALVRGPSR